MLISPLKEGGDIQDHRSVIAQQHWGDDQQQSGFRHDSHTGCCGCADGMLIAAVAPFTPCSCMLLLHTGVAGMMEGPQGFDQSSGLWEARGWRQVDALRRKLEKLKELRELVRSLGRAGGRGPRRRAPEEVGYEGIHLSSAREIF